MKDNKQHFFLSLDWAITPTSAECLPIVSSELSLLQNVQQSIKKYSTNRWPLCPAHNVIAGQINRVLFIHENYFNFLRRYNAEKWWYEYIMGFSKWIQHGKV